MLVPAHQDLLVCVAKGVRQVVHWTHHLDEAFGHMCRIPTSLRGAHGVAVFRDLHLRLFLRNSEFFFGIFLFEIKFEISMFCCFPLPLLWIVLNVTFGRPSRVPSFDSGTLLSARLSLSSLSIQTRLPSKDLFRPIQCDSISFRH